MRPFVSVRTFAVAALGAAALVSVAPAQAQTRGNASGEANFQGIYVGAHAGAGFGRAGGARSNGFVGGVQGGANFQSGRAVVGVEADVSLSNQSATNFANRYRQGAQGSIRGRAGYVIEKLLVYGTVGASMRASEWQTPVSKSSKTMTGWVYGAGAEMPITDKVNIRGEYLRYDYGRETYATGVGSATVKPTTSVVRGGLNYRF